MRRIAISSGHGKYVRGAAGSPVPPELDERDENVRVVDRVFEHLQTIGAGVGKFHDETSRSQGENLDRIVAWHNSQSRDLDVSIHFNAGGSDQLMGTEVLWVTQQALAAEVSKAIADVAGWPNRGAKKRMDLAFLNGTNKPAILIETCFCDSHADSARYQERFEDICLQIAEHIADQAVAPGPTPEPEPPEPVPPEPGEPATVDITITGNVLLTVNGQKIILDGGDDTQPDEDANRQNIIATVFSSVETGAQGAYGDWLDPSMDYVALPMRFEGERPKVKVTGPSGSKVADIMDVGPWLTDDVDYASPDGMARPLAETCYKNGTPLPRGPNKGRVPNGAGIDLSPALASAIGIEGKGNCDWEFV
jgi:N-acetylmuramoyl-L-alanine amidase